MSPMLNTEKQPQGAHLSHWRVLARSFRGPVFLIVHILHDKIKSIPIHHILHMHSFFSFESMPIKVVLVLISKFLTDPV